MGGFLTCILVLFSLVYFGVNMSKILDTDFTTLSMSEMSI